MAKRQPPIDWAQMVRDLEAAGMTQEQIGVSCDFDRSSAASWANRLKNIPGTEPKFHNGALLLGLWSVKMGRVANDVPRELV